MFRERVSLVMLVKGYKKSETTKRDHVQYNWHHLPLLTHYDLCMTRRGSVMGMGALGIGSSSLCRNTQTDRHTDTITNWIFSPWSISRREISS